MVNYILVAHRLSMDPILETKVNDFAEYGMDHH